MPGLMKWVANWAVTTETESALWVDKRSWFQSRIVLGKNDCYQEVLLAYGTTYDLVTLVLALA